MPSLNVLKVNFKWPNCLFNASKQKKQGLKKINQEKYYWKEEYIQQEKQI